MAEQGPPDEVFEELERILLAASIPLFSCRAVAAECTVRPTRRAPGATQTAEWGEERSISGTSGQHQDRAEGALGPA